VILKALVELLHSYVEDAVSRSEHDVRNFEKEQGIFLREDHERFLIKYGAEPGRRLDIFKWYGGDYGFDVLRGVYLEKSLDMEPPLGATFFGVSFVGESFCIDQETGQIFLYDEGQRFGLVHEGIDGFLLRCMLSIYNEQAFSSKSVERDVSLQFIDEFRLKNKGNKIVGATSYELTYANIDCPEVVSEYYLADGKVFALYPPTRSLVTLGGGVLEHF